MFVGLELPDAVRAALQASMGGMAGARWQRDEQLHLTLRFIGAVDRHTAADIAAALGRVHLRPFTAELGDPGHFSSRGRIDTLWVGVRPADALAALAQRVNAALVGVGLAADQRAFVPHITVARGRMAGSADPQAGWPQSPVPRISWPISHIALFESHLGHGGSDYRVIGRWP